MTCLLLLKHLHSFLTGALNWSLVSGLHRHVLPFLLVCAMQELKAILPDDSAELAIAGSLPFSIGSQASFE